MAPIFGVAFGVVVWGDTPGPKLLVGGAMVLAGVLTVAIRSRHRTRI
jgi:O-acetylserine/cysteine efflux transporter